MVKNLLTLLIVSFSIVSYAQEPQIQGGSQAKILSEVNKPVFRKNGGQYESEVLYRMTSGQSSIAFFKDKIQFGLRKQGKKPMKSREDMGSMAFAVWELSFQNMNSGSKLMASEQFQTRFNRFGPGSETAIDIEEYGKLTYKNVFENIDLVFYLDKNQTLKYDFIVHPGGDYSQIKLLYDGVKKLKTDNKGNLSMVTPWGNRIKEGKPVCWQITSGGKVPVNINYSVSGKTLSYEASSPLQPNATLIIDPMMLDWSSYFYGKNVGISTWGWTYVLDMDIDKENYVYVTGMTTEAYPTKVGTYDTSMGTSFNYEGFVAKMSLNADSLLLFTYIGGTSWEYVLSIAVNAQMQPVISGITYGNDYPITSNAYDKTTGSGSGYRGFITKFSKDFKTLVYSTYFGKANNWFNVIQSMVLAPNGDVIFTGSTSAQDFPTTTGCLQSTYGGGTNDAFLSRLSADGSKLVYSTYFGGTGDDQSFDLSINATEDVYVVGLSKNSNFPVTVGSKIFKTSNSDGCDGFVCRISFDGKKLIWSHLMGGSGIDAFEGLYVNANDELYIAGYSNSSDFYTTLKAVQPSNAGGYDHVVVKLNRTGTNVYYSTYLGGGNDDYFYSGGIWASNIRITANVKDEAIIGGITRSTNYPITTDALQPKNRAGSTSWWATNLAITKLNYDGDKILYGTYFGGSYWEWPTVLKVKKISCMSSILYGGITGSIDYPTTKGVYHEKGKTVNGNYTGFMSRFRDTLYTEPIEFKENFVECDEVFEILDAKNRGANYLWSDGSKKQNLIVTEPGKYWVRATYGCDTVSDTIKILLEYSAKLNLPADTTLCDNPVGFTLDAENDTILRKYYWSTGDTTQTIKPNKAGLYKVMVKTPNCGFAEDSTQLKFLTSPNLKPIKDTVFCDTINWPLKSDSLGPGTKYYWSTNDSTINTKITTVGSYQLKVSNYCGVDSISFNTSMLYKPQLKLPNDTIICDNIAMKYKVGRPMNEETYDWYDPIVKTQYTNADSIDIYTEGYYAISIKNKCGEALDTIVIDQKNTPVIDLGNDSTYCNSINKTLITGTQNNSESYLWNTGKTVNQETVLTPGKYWARIKNLCGEASDTVNFIKKVNLKIELGNDTLFCDAVLKNLDITQPDPEAVYSWMGGTNTTPTYTANTPGKVFASITNFCGTVSDEVTYSLLTSPKIELGNDYLFCDNIVPVSRNIGKADNGETYLWSDNSTGTSAEFYNKGKHWAQISNICGTVSDTFKITVVTSPTVNVGPDTALCGVFAMHLDAGNPGLTYFWEPTGETTQKIIANQQAIYKVTVTDADGCFGVDDMQVKDDCKSKWHIPTSFSPNGDGINEEFGPLLINCEYYSLSIFNTWGEKMFETTDPFVKWNGTYLGNVVQDGNYLYIIHFKSSESKKWYNINGGVLLIR